ncbi:hypothetical protein V9K67_23465 [Paraflavisolibacter sp. H34]|uniref:hypothetical protein n=1 Tax=Huijunlia imazamoxiresistens TaxID=3127457 RepID=UPI00301953A9
MRKGVFAALAAIVTGFSACDKVVDAVVPDFPITTSSISVEVPVISNTTQVLAIDTASLYLNIDSVVMEKSDGKIGYNKVNSIKITKIAFTASNTDANNNLGNLESAKVMFHTDSNPTPVEIASTPIAATETSFKEIVPSPQQELKGYLNGKRLTYTLHAKARKATTKPIPLSMVVTFNVDL